MPKNPNPVTSTRRTFIKAASAAALAAPVAPTILAAADKSGSKKPLVGTGAFKYEVTHYFGELPDHVQWGETHGVCVDREGLIYVKHRSHAATPVDAIVVFDAQGKFVRSFGKRFHHGGHGIDVRLEGKEEFLYLSDVTNRVTEKTNLKGETVWRKTYPKEPGVYKSARQYSPTNICFSPDGGFYICDGYGSHYIHQYDKDANWVRTWGGAGTAPGKMKTPHGMWLDDRPGRQPSIVVADRANARLQYFSLDGKHLGFVGNMSFPADCDIRGEVLLVPDLHARITLLDKDNKVITHLGYDAAWTKKVLDGFKVRRNRKAWPDGRFVHPHDACFDKTGNIYVAEWVLTGRVSFLRHVS